MYYAYVRKPWPHACTVYNTVYMYVHVCTLSVHNIVMLTLNVHKLHVVDKIMSGHMFTGLHELWPPHCLQANDNMKTYHGLTNNVTCTHTVMSSTPYSCF